MGYTHSWTPKATSEDKFKVFARTCKQLHKNLDKSIKICGGNGTGKPLFRNDEVWFNGDEEKDLDNETLHIELNNTDWSFCKTARKPYDILVVAVLIAAHEILGYEVDSDGEFEDWKEGIEFYLSTLYHQMPDEDGMKLILPKFLFDDENGTEYYKFKNKYSIMDYVKSLFVVVK